MDGHTEWSLSHGPAGSGSHHDGKRAARCRVVGGNGEFGRTRTGHSGGRERVGHIRGKAGGGKRNGSSEVSNSYIGRDGIRGPFRDRKGGGAQAGGNGTDSDRERGRLARRGGRG